MSKTILFKKVPLLSDLPRSELDTLAATLETIELAPAQTLFNEGEPGESLFIVLEGRLDVIMAMGTKDEKTIAALGPGEFVGEMSLLIPGRARTASVRAIRQTRLWKMTHVDFQALLLRQPTLAYTMVRTLTRRLDATNSSTFQDLQEKNKQLQTAYDELKAAQAQIVEKERLERELQVAAEIQMSILPQSLPVIPGYDFGAHMHPARMVGGDFYDVFPVDESHIGAVIGDVTDKGVPSAIFMARAHVLIMSEAAHGGTPGEIIRRVNRHLIHLDQSDLFVTVLFGILECSSGRFDYVRAGHEHPLLMDAHGRVEILKQGVGQPVGIFDGLLLDEGSLIISTGGALLLFTDGVTDCRSPEGQTFGYEKLHKVFSRAKRKTGTEICGKLIANLQKYQGEAAQEDDITLLVIHRQE